MSKRILTKNLKEHIGREVTIAGWVDVRRDHGKLIFIDLRDATGKVQMVILPNHKEAHELAQKVRPEWVIEVVGKVNNRPEKLVNKNEPNGEIEVEVLELKVLNEAETPPIDISGDGKEINEETRLKYRYLDLRRPRLQKNIRIRSEFVDRARQYLFGKGFTEIETPYFTSTTPEGSRDFVVPSRMYPGKFFALPQSPQQYKQLLMVAGFERYFQIAPCFRDEDARADRSPGEFYQIDMEMSFVSQDDVLELTEGMFTTMVKKLFPEKHLTFSPWPRLKHFDVMKKYNTDKPDLRKNKNDTNELAFAWIVDFPLFTEQSAEDFFHGSGNSKWAPSHHMFTRPKEEDLPLLDTEPGKVRSYQHDLVLNGLEVGGGSLRIHDPVIQEKIWDLIGFSQEQKKQFAHLIEAFQYGVPPHGGIAPGLDRLVSILCGEKNIRETIAFPLTGDVRDPLMGAPDEVSKEQLKELGLKM